MTDHELLLTPEKVVLNFRTAGVASRCGAHLIDLLLAFLAASVPGAVFGFLSPVLGADATMMLGSLASLLVLLGYFVFFEAYWQGQTPGKRATGIRVLMVDGTPLTFAAALYRNLLRPADLLPGIYLVGLMAMFLNPRSQRLGDLAAGTMVVAHRNPSLGFTPAPHRVGIHRYEEYVGNLNRVSIEEYQALKRICDRYPWLPLEAQKWSVDVVWTPFATKHGVPPIEGVDPVYLMQAVVMKFGRMHKLI